MAVSAHFLSSNFIRIPAFFAFLLSLGCSPTTDRAKGVFSHLPPSGQGVSMEVMASVDQQAAMEILASSSVFNVSFDEDPGAWIRAKLFFEKFLPVEAGKSAVVTRIVGKKWVLASSPSQPDNFIYEVSREEIPGAYRYNVKCLPKRNPVAPQTLELNAKNVARFIREGKFEVSLLTR